MKLNTVHNMDCLEGLSSIPDNSIDCCITDPPYPVISGGKPKSKNHPGGMLSKNDGKIFTHNDISFKEWMSEVYRVLKDGSQCYIFTNVLNLSDCLAEAKKSGFQLHNLLVWEKNNATPNRWYMKNAEYVLFLRKGRAKAIKDKGSKTVHRFDNIIGKKIHPCEKPISLLKYYILNSTEEGDIVLDPFMGSYATAIAALETGRNYIGFEKDEEYYEVGEKRLDEWHKN